MYKFIAILLFGVLFCGDAMADAKIYLNQFDVNMDMDISNLQEYINKMKEDKKVYDKGYISRVKMGKTFKKEFSKTIKYYGMSEQRIKSYYEDDLLDMLTMLPKEMYPYIGPMLHEIPGMSEKILNMPGIKETKNKFPEEIKEEYQGIEGIEFLSPALYVALMPNFWKKKKTDLDTPQEEPAQKPKKKVKLPNYLTEKENLPVPQAEKEPAGATVKVKKAQATPNQRTLYPTLTSPLTQKDAEAFLATIDDIVEWGDVNQKKRLLMLIKAGFLLDAIENEQGTALVQNTLKDAVNPCQRLILKTKVAGLYNEFAKVVAPQGFSPEEWAYTCDKTVKAFRVAETKHDFAYAIQFHRRGYYNKYIKMLPKKLQTVMFESEAALIAMYSVFIEDVEAVRPIKGKLRQKFDQIEGVFLIQPIIY